MPINGENLDYQIDQSQTAELAVIGSRLTYNRDKRLKSLIE